MSEIKTAITKQGLSQRQVAKNMELSTTTVSNLLNGHSNNITLDTLWKLCKAADFDLEINLVRKYDDFNLESTVADLHRRIERIECMLFAAEDSGKNI